MQVQKESIKATAEANVSRRPGSRKQGRTKGGKGSSLNSCSTQSSVHLNLHSMGTKSPPAQELGEPRSTGWSEIMF